jgi:predicted SAM-dependent methyltransferase
MIEKIEYKGEFYPKFQSMGNASQFAIPYALHVCKGKGYDIGCMKKEWSFPNSIPIDLSFDDNFHATNLPDKNVDYIFSSHCLEHIVDWVKVMDYWYGTLKVGGVLFLYLPDYSQKYWRPWNNRKHINIFSPEIIKDYMEDRGYHNIFYSSTDLNNSFMIFGEKK